VKKETDVFEEAVDEVICEVLRVASGLRCGLTGAVVAANDLLEVYRKLSTLKEAWKGGPINTGVDEACKMSRTIRLIRTDYYFRGQPVFVVSSGSEAIDFATLEVWRARIHRFIDPRKLFDILPPPKSVNYIDVQTESFAPAKDPFALANV